MKTIQQEMERLILERGRELRDKEANQTIVIDGLTNPALYEKSTLKIVFVLKEAYETDESNLESWNHTVYLNDPDFYILDKKTYPTHYVVSKIASGLLRNWLFRNHMYDKMWNNSPTDAEILKDFQSIGWINIGKFPAPAQSLTSKSRLNEAYADWKDVVFAQIDAYNPDIVILGGTFDAINDNGGFGEDNSPFGEIQYKAKEAMSKAYTDGYGRLIISTYHPSNRGSREKYVNSIIHLARKVPFRKGIIY